VDWVVAGIGDFFCLLTIIIIGKGVHVGGDSILRFVSIVDFGGVRVRFSIVEWEPCPFAWELSGLWV